MRLKYNHNASVIILKLHKTRGKKFVLICQNEAIAERLKSNENEDLEEHSQI